jgi:ATP synthase protein I
MTGLSTGFAISVYLLSAVLVWGGIGYLIDRWMGIEGAFTAVGAVVGAGAGIYLVYLRYGREHDEKR